jgi:hypothetical protein
VSHKTAIVPNVPNSKMRREAGVPIADVFTLVGTTGGTLGAKSVSARASEFVSGAGDATTNEGDIGPSVGDENAPVGWGLREAIGGRAVSGEVLLDSFCAAPLGSNDLAGAVGEMFKSASTTVCGNGNSAWASAAERASLVSLSGAASGAVRRPGVDVAVWEGVSPSSRKYQQRRLVPPSLR